MIVHRVQQGERLSTIAQAYGVSTGSIVDANPAMPPRMLPSGERVFAALAEGDDLIIPVERSVGLGAGHNLYPYGVGAPETTDELEKRCPHGWYKDGADAQGRKRCAPSPKPGFLTMEYLRTFAPDSGIEHPKRRVSVPGRVSDPHAEKVLASLGVTSADLKQAEKDSTAYRVVCDAPGCGARTTLYATVEQAMGEARKQGFVRDADKPDDWYCPAHAKDVRRVSTSMLADGPDMDEGAMDRMRAKFGVLGAVPPPPADPLPPHTFCDQGGTYHAGLCYFPSQFDMTVNPPSCDAHYVFVDKATGCAPDSNDPPPATSNPIDDCAKQGGIYDAKLNTCVMPQPTTARPYTPWLIGGSIVLATGAAVAAVLLLTRNPK